MKFIFNNMYIESKMFESFRAFSHFIETQNVKKLKLEESQGDKYYCYLGCDSLSQKKLFAVYFESNQKESDLNILVWNKKTLFVLDTGMYLYFIDEALNIKSVFEIFTPLIGLHITKGGNLLVLEEASVRLINDAGEILKSQLFDYIENFHIKDDQLSFQVNGEEKFFDLV